MPIPSGLFYKSDFLLKSEESALLEQLKRLPLAPFQLRSVSSHRLVCHFGWDYQYEHWRLRPADPIPDFLLTLRDKAAALLHHPADPFEEALINAYPRGAGIGWHRDAPMFGSPVIGISLGEACRLRFRRKTESGYELFEQPLEPRSIYSLSGEARHIWQHTIPPVKAYRLSVTFRTIIKRPAVLA